MQLNHGISCSPWPDPIEFQFHINTSPQQTPELEYSETEMNSSPIVDKICPSKSPHQMVSREGDIGIGLAIQITFQLKAFCGKCKVSIY